MSSTFPEYKDFDLAEINKEVLDKWERESVFRQSLDAGKNNPAFVFYEGPPSANGLPGIHHVMARTIKDIFCRFKTQKGFLVHRKAGWDTHGLPVELGVEKAMGITREDIGKSVSIEEYNDRCRKDVMKYTDVWEDLTARMGFWLDMADPYITYKSKYIETLWWLLKGLYDKGLLYKGYTVQPYSPAAGTGLSSHELNLPGCYKTVKDTTGVVMFKIIRNKQSEFLYKNITTDLFILAWTTTPWTLLSNTALAVGKDILYSMICTFNPYSGRPVAVILAKDLVHTLFPEKNSELRPEDYSPGDRNIPFSINGEYKGSKLAGIRYEQLLPYRQPENGDAFRVVTGDFVSTDEGTGVVHIAPSFGADDLKVAKENDIGSLTLVDKRGCFVDSAGEFSGRFVKNSYDPSIPEDTDPVDVDIIVKLKKENKLFKTEKYEHSYPHCWRTDQPILYYPLDSWFIRSTAMKDRMIELNRTINWQPSVTGSGRFGQWLENLVDWNLSRSRYWGTPLPIWRTEDGTEEICIGSFASLKEECEKALVAGVMNENPLKDFQPGDLSEENYNRFDPHRPYVDKVILVSPSGKPMYREPDLIDVWFDSGAMPYGQLHYPFDNQEFFKSFFPADFIAEGVDQTRGWFFTLHAIAVMLFDSVAFRNIISNGLVLDKDGNKMSKRLGNAVDPFEVIKKYGSDPLRWYLMTNAAPWENLKFDTGGIEEVKRKFFGTLFNTYSFFALYANVDGFRYSDKHIPEKERSELDRWILSRLNSLIRETGQHYGNYDPTKACRGIQQFVTDHLSNWYVRLSRKRYWMGEYSNDKISAYQTLYTCLETVARLAAPVAPFYMDKLFCDLVSVTGIHKATSVHLTGFPEYNESLTDSELETRMELAQRISSLILGLRRKVNLKVRQPLALAKIPVRNPKDAGRIRAVENIILTEVNIKKIEMITDEDESIVKKIKPNFKTLGPRFGKMMKQISSAIAQLQQDDILHFEENGRFDLIIDGLPVTITAEDVEIYTEDIPGWLVASEGGITVALDINVTPLLKDEGIAREFINRIQNYRKETGLDVTDKIYLYIQEHELINSAIKRYAEYIKSQTLALSINLVEKMEQNNGKHVEIDNGISTNIHIEKANS